VTFGWGRSSDAPAREPVWTPVMVFVATTPGASPETIRADALDPIETALVATRARGQVVSSIAGAAGRCVYFVDEIEDRAAARAAALAAVARIAGGLAGTVAEVHAVEVTDAGGTGVSTRLRPPDPAAAPILAGEPVAAQPAGFLQRLADGLSRSSRRLAEGVASAFTKRRLDTETLDELEEMLIASDLGARAAGRLRAGLEKDRFGKDVTDEEVREALAAGIAEILRPRQLDESPFDGRAPRVILLVGVNGSGKTTTIGKIAANLAGAGRSVLLAAGDTFRAAAVEQLKVWGERAGVPVMSRGPGADAAGLAYDAFEAARRDGTEVLLIDTAGRLQNRTELMAELAKIVRVLKKLDPEAPHEVWLVLDATVGQNALSQTEAFRHTAGVTGLIMTKLDGTAKGGVLVALSEAHALPIRFIGVGEGVQDLAPFEADAFARALVGLS
jgi:fused signal recognition particle receptor